MSIIQTEDDDLRGDLKDKPAKVFVLNDRRHLFMDERLGDGNFGFARLTASGASKLICSKTFSVIVMSRRAPMFSSIVLACAAKIGNGFDGLLIKRD